MRAILSFLLLSLLSNSHDISTLPSWGPYSKNYAGISHISDRSSGVRFDFSVMPGFYRRSYSVPNVLYESGYHPWEASADMTHISYRYELEWKDRVYVDLSYDLLDSTRVLVTARCVNNTPTPQNLLLNNVASIAYQDHAPQLVLRGSERLAVAHIADYQVYTPAVKAHDYLLEYDGLSRSEVLDAQALSGRALKGFGTNAGDRLECELQAASFGRGKQRVALRYMLPKGQSCALRFEGALNGELRLVGSGQYELAYLDTALKGRDFAILALGGDAVRLDAVIVGPKEDVDNLTFEANRLPYRPRVEKLDGGYVAKYEDVDTYYGLAWNYPYVELREFENSELDVFMRRAVHRHPPRYFGGDKGGDFLSAFARPITLEGGQSAEIRMLLVTGRREYVGAQIAEFHRDEAAFAAPSAKASEKKLLPQAEPYRLGQQLLQATLLTNIVYPVYTQGEYIRHFTPGKNWNSLYTWDSGFISMALNDIDPTKAFETLRAYTTEEGSNVAFIHHGTPLPTQFFAFSDWANKVDSPSELEFLYPRLKRYYDFMAGHESSSTTRMSSNLLRTWDYFYSSGGWDDYPPQHELRTSKHLYPYVAPVVSTSYYIRAAKILRLCARRLGLSEDVEHYSRDISEFSQALQSYAWDEEAGYFGYVMHDEALRPSGLYLAPDGSNFNKGLDGVSPLVAGICTPEQRSRLIGNIFSPERMWTPIGISTVDQSASYYSPNGYWNGCVWFPHQFVLWKTMLDLGEAELAHKIAFTSLDLWKRECSLSYNCFEHFIISSGRGAGWHNFSGLSSPLINLFCSYFEQGKISTGFDVMVQDSEFAEDYSSFSASLLFDSDAQNPSIMLCLNPEFEYEASLDGVALDLSSPYPGLVVVSLPVSKSYTILRISKQNTI